MKTFTTEMEYSIQGFYSGEWEEVTSESNSFEGKQRLKEYRENESVPFRMIRKRIPVAKTPVWLHFKSNRNDCFLTLRSFRIGAYALVSGRWRKVSDGSVKVYEGSCEVQDMKREHFVSDREAWEAGVKV